MPRDHVCGGAVLCVLTVATLVGCRDTPVVVKTVEHTSVAAIHGAEAAFRHSWYGHPIPGEEEHRAAVWYADLYRSNPYPHPEFWLPARAPYDPQTDHLSLEPVWSDVVRSQRLVP